MLYYDYHVSDIQSIAISNSFPDIEIGRMEWIQAALNLLYSLSILCIYFFNRISSYNPYQQANVVILML